MSPRLGYKQTAEHIRNSKRAKKKYATRKKKRAPLIYQVVDMANTDTLHTLWKDSAWDVQFGQQPKMTFDAARAYLTRFDTTPDADLTPEERFIKRMGGKG